MLTVSDGKDSIRGQGWVKEATLPVPNPSFPSSLWGHTMKRFGKIHENIPLKRGSRRPIGTREFVASEPPEGGPT